MSRRSATRRHTSSSRLSLLFSCCQPPAVQLAAIHKQAGKASDRPFVLTAPPAPIPQVQQVALGGLLQKLVAVFIAGIPLVVVGGLMYAFIAQEDVMAGFLVRIDRWMGGCMVE